MAIFIPIHVSWNGAVATCNFKQFKRIPPYQKLYKEEPVGFLWESRHSMFIMGAHGTYLSGICHIQNIVYSIIENGDQQNKYEPPHIIYCGHGSKRKILQSANKALANMGCFSQSFRLYVGHKSSNELRPTQGFCLFGLVFVNQFYCTSYNRIQKGSEGFSSFKQRKNHQKHQFSYQWNFVISYTPPLPKEVNTMLQLFHKYSK